MTWLWRRLAVRSPRQLVFRPNCGRSFPTDPEPPARLSSPLVDAASREPRLLDRVRLAVRARHYSLRTEEAYVGWVKRFVLFHGKRHPQTMGEPEINAFLSDLAVRQGMSASTQRLRRVGGYA